MQTEKYDDPIDRETRASAMVIDVMTDGDRATCNLAVERILMSGTLVLVEVTSYIRYSIDWTEAELLRLFAVIDDVPMIRLVGVDLVDDSDVVYANLEQIVQLMASYLARDYIEDDGEPTFPSPRLITRLSRLAAKDLT